jgi:ABC-type uncharacterized transport system permease subunit
LLNTITLLCYLTGSLAQAFASFKNKPSQTLIFWISLFAVTLHGLLLYSWIDVSAGQNLTEFNLLSLATWVTALLIFGLSLKKPVAYLIILIFPLAALSIFLASAFPSHHIIQTAADLKQCIHILLSVITFAVLSIAALQAITLLCQEKLLKRKNFQILELLPPIETMEKMLFQTILVGFVLLSAVLGTSIYFFNQILFNQFLQKTVLTCIAWFVFSLLLIGRYYFGWRGKKAIYCTLSGVLLLAMVYFGSMIIMELLP